MPFWQISNVLPDFSPAASSQRQLAKSCGHGNNDAFMGRRSKLIQARERQGLSRQALAEFLGVSRQYVLRVENGQRHPSHEIMVRWADALYTSMDTFRQDAEPQSQSAA